MGFRERVQKVLTGQDADFFPQTRVDLVVKTSDYTCVAQDSGKVFTTTGAGAAVTFTLPNVAITGWHAWFFNAVDEDMTVTGAAANLMVCFNNNSTADSVTYSTASETCGGFYLVSDGTHWLVFGHLGQDTQTITIAT